MVFCSNNDWLIISIYWKYWQPWGKMCLSSLFQRWYNANVGSDSAMSENVLKHKTQQFTSLLLQKIFSLRWEAETMKAPAANPGAHAASPAGALSVSPGTGTAPESPPGTLERLKVRRAPLCTLGVLFPMYSGLWNSSRSRLVNWRDQSQTHGNLRPFSSPSWMFLLIANSCKKS